MKEQLKLSIRFFNDREVRAVWDDEHSKWWFNVLDIVGVLNEETGLYQSPQLLEIPKSQTKKRE